MSALFSPGPYHLFTYSLLLGSQVYRTFISDIVPLRKLEAPPRPRHPDPLLFFKVQAVCPAILILTCPFSLESTKNIFTCTIPLAVEIAVGVWGYSLADSALQRFEEACHRRELELREEDERQRAQKGTGNNKRNPVTDSDQYLGLYKTFWVAVAAANLLSVVGIGAGVVYGFKLARRMM